MIEEVLYTLSERRKSVGRNKFSFVVYIIIGLAIFGLISQLIGNPMNFFKEIIFMIGMAVIVFAVFYFIFFRKRSSSNEMKKYKQAVKQSKRKYKQNKNIKTNHKSKRPSVQKTRKKISKRPTHLRVIDGGHRSKRKKRASN